MPKRIKYAYIRKLHKEIDADRDDSQVYQMINERILRVIKINTDVDELLPKKAMSLAEFNAIRANFSGADFERNSNMPMSIFMTSGILWFIQRAFTKIKWRI